MRARFSPPRIRWAWWLGVFCIALVLMSGVIQVAHFHANGQVDPDCSLCLAAHQIAHVAAPITLHLTSLRVAAVVVPRTLSRPRPALAFRLISRPPPSPGLSLA
jgi:hypothetical protein